MASEVRTGSGKSWQLLSERPATEDLLGRNVLAQALAQAIYDRKGSELLISVTGPPGSGKSTFLELLHQWLGDDPRLLVVRFQPMPGSGNVLGLFFLTLMASFREKAAGDAIQSLERAIQGIASLLLDEPDHSFAKTYSRFSKFPNLGLNFDRLVQKLCKVLQIRRVVALVDGADALSEAERAELGWGLTRLLRCPLLDIVVAGADPDRWLGGQAALAVPIPAVSGVSARAALETWGVPAAYLRGVEALLDARPKTARELKRFCNHLHQSLVATESLESVQPQILAALLWLEFAWPELYADIGRYGAALLDAMARQDEELLSRSPMLQAYGSDAQRKQIVDSYLALPSPEREQTLAYVLSKSPPQAGTEADRMFEDLLSRDRFRLERALRWVRRQSGMDFIRRLEHTVSVGDLTARRQAIELMGQIGGPATASLLRILESGERPEKLASIQSLGAARAGEAVEALIAAGEADETLAEAIYEALGFIGGDRAVSMLIRVLNTGKPASRVWAARAIGHTKSERAVPYLVEQILQGSREERSAAVAGLKGVGREAGVQQLLRSVQSGTLEEKANGLEALSALGGDAARTQILHMLRIGAEEDMELVEAALRVSGTPEFFLSLTAEVVSDPQDKEGRMLGTLARIAGDRVVRPLVKQLHSAQAEHRSRAAQSLLQIKSEAVVSELTEEIQFANLLYEDQAIQIVGQIGGERACDFLLECLRQGRAIAATVDALAILQDPRSLQALARLSIQEAGDLQKESRRALKMVPGNLMIEQYLSLVRSADPDTRRRIGEAMAEVLGARAVYRLIEEMRYGDRTLRSLAMDLLAAIGGEEVVVALVNLLESGELRDKELARDALIVVRAPESVVHLVDLLGHQDVDVRVQAALALGHVGGPEAVDPLLDLAQRGQPQDKRAAAQALGTLREPRAVPKLIDLIRLDTGDVWYVAAEALQLIGEPATQALLGMLRSKKRNDQKVGAAVVGHLKLRGAMPALLELLEHEDWSLRGVAAQALGQIGDPQAIGPLAALLQSENHNDRRSAGEALAAIGGPDVLEAVSALGQGAEAPLRVELASLLGAMEPDLATELLLEALADEDAEVRRSAALASVRQDDPRVLEVLAGWHRSGDPELQGLVEDVLGRMGHARAMQTLVDLGVTVPADGPVRPAPSRFGAPQPASEEGPAEGGEAAELGDEQAAGEEVYDEYGDGEPVEEYADEEGAEPQEGDEEEAEG
jgi:HEAT repeat protein